MVADLISAIASATAKTIDVMPISNKNIFVKNTMVLKFNHLINLSKNVIKNKPCIYANLEDFNHFNHLITETIL